MAVVARPTDQDRLSDQMTERQCYLDGTIGVTVTLPTRCQEMPPEASIVQRREMYSPRAVMHTADPYCLLSQYVRISTGNRALLVMDLDSKTGAQPCASVQVRCRRPSGATVLKEEVRSLRTRQSSRPRA